MSTDNRQIKSLRPEGAASDVSISDNILEKRLPHDVQTLLLLGIFLILIFYTLYFVREIVLPIILAFVLFLILRPSMRYLSKLRIPKVIAALLVIAVLFSGISALGFTLSGPVTEWIAKAPKALPRLERRLSFVMKPLADVQRTSEQVEKLGDSVAPGIQAITVKGPSLGSLLASGTRTFLAGLLTSVVLLFFLLISGDLFLRRFVEILPTLSNKKQAVDISNEIERHLSIYLITISLTSATVGVATGFAVYFCGLSDPVLWGTVAFLLNYVMILGPITCAVIIFLAGLLTFDSTWQAVLPMVIYISLNFLEGNYITPMLLARRLTLNPVLIIVSLIFWYWMWGVAGALLAVPLLGSFKVICDRVKPLMAIGHFLGTSSAFDSASASPSASH